MNELIEKYFGHIYHSFVSKFRNTVFFIKKKLKL